MRILTLVILLILQMQTSAMLFNVGPTRQYTKPSQVMPLISDGDSVYIDAGVYTADVGVWTKNRLYIRGINGYAHLKAAGAYAQSKAIWVVQGDSNTIEWIEFSECSVPDKNGAGIRFEGTGLVLRHCYFHHNENGILTNNNDESEILIEFCEFAYNGYGDGYSHNLYINHIKNLIFRFNYTHHANVGHTLKSRAYSNEILYNCFSDGADGNSSMLLDLPNGGFSVVLGNIFYQGPSAVNRSLLTYGLEGLSNPSSLLYVINNTMVSERSVATFLKIQAGTSALTGNNIFAGNGVPIDGMATDSANVYYATVADARFKDPLNFDFSLIAGSTAIDHGANFGFISVYPLFADYEYRHKADSETRVISGAEIDKGAFEYIHPLSIIQNKQNEQGISHYDQQGRHYFEWRKVENEKHFSISVYTVSGVCLLSQHVDKTSFHCSGLPEGFYIVKVFHYSTGNSETLKFYSKGM